MTTAQQVIQLVQSLFSIHPQASISPQQRKDADKWLRKFQETVISFSSQIQTDAWSVADQIINDENAPTEARMFAAQTFRQKVGLEM